MYGDKITNSMRRAIMETDRRRKIQSEYNRKNHITPRSIYKTIDEILKTTRVADSRLASSGVKDPTAPYLMEIDREERLEALERAMHEAAARLEFEKAAQYRDELERLRAEG